MSSPSACVLLDGLRWSAADARPLLSDLTLHLQSGRMGLVGRNGSGKTTLLRLIAGDLPPEGGRVQVSGRLGWMRQEVASAAHLTVADLFGVAPALARLRRIERGVATDTDLTEADWTLPARIEAALQRCGVSVAPEEPLAPLSGGQRTRVALAAQIFQAPDILLLDEPTNTLDAEGRAMVRRLLRDWRGLALVVSHDRAVLEEMDAIVELRAGGAQRYAGPYSQYRAERDMELAAAYQDLHEAEKTRKETLRRAQDATERKARRDSQGRAARASGSQPKVLLDKAKERAEASKGAGVRLREARRAEAEAALAEARERIEVLEPIQMEIPATGLRNQTRLVALQHITAGYGPHTVLRDFSLEITGPERIAVMGPNGCGKTTLLSLILGHLEPHAGHITRPAEAALLDQHLSLLKNDETLLENYLRLNPDVGAQDAHAALARFRFRASEALWQAAALSSGQRLRAGLACTLARPTPPPLLVLDEPTNHLDLEGLEALEAALLGYDGALIVVSHDSAFLDRIALTRRLVLPSQRSGSGINSLSSPGGS